MQTYFQLHPATGSTQVPMAAPLELEPVSESTPEPGPRARAVGPGPVTKFWQQDSPRAAPWAWEKGENFLMAGTAHTHSQTHT